MTFDGVNYWMVAALSNFSNELAKNGNSFQTMAGTVNFLGFVGGKRFHPFRVHP